MKKRVAYWIVLIVVLASCKKVQPEMTGDNNCDCAKEVSASFKMGQIFDGQLIDLDTVHYYLSYDVAGGVVSSSLNGNCYISFSADLEDAISYEWKIGNDPTIHTNREFGLYFNDTVGTIPVRLIVKGVPNTICFPNDDGIDTIVRYLTVKTMSEPYLFGQYQGANTDTPNDQFVIEIDTFRYVSINSGEYIRYGINNLPVGNTFDQLTWLNSTSFEGVNESGDGLIQFINAVKGFYNHKTGEIHITYSARYYSSSFQILNQLDSKTFVGTKI